jgi:signal transduction histidine kinase
MTRRSRPAELFAVDAVLALVLTLVCAYAATEEPLAAGLREPLWLSWLAGVLIGAPVAVRRRSPIVVAGVVLVASVAALLSGVIPDYAAAAPSAALACALYAVGVATPRRRSVAVLAVCLAGMGGALAVAATDVRTDIAGIGFACLMIGAAWIAGWAVRERRASAADMAEQLTHRAVSDERLRITRELHDIVAHSMTLIAVKAAVANHVAEASPREAREALRVIEGTSRGALLEIRRALGVLRDGASYAPAPGLGDVATLAEQAATGGVDVELDVRGGADLPEGVGLAVFRIVQESLTNVVKHAAPARCRATVAVDQGEVRIEVTDDGRRAAPPATRGQGLIGMRERVGMYGGDFAAGRRPEGGFRVTARLPYASVS